MTPTLDSSVLHEAMPFLMGRFSGIRDTFKQHKYALYPEGVALTGATVVHVSGALASYGNESLPVSGYGVVGREAYHGRVAVLFGSRGQTCDTKMLLLVDDQMTHDALVRAGLEVQFYLLPGIRDQPLRITNVLVPSRWFPQLIKRWGVRDRDVAVLKQRFTDAGGTRQQKHPA